jgi:hypothetical protein
VHVITLLIRHHEAQQRPSQSDDARACMLLMTTGALAGQRRTARSRWPRCARRSSSIRSPDARAVPRRACTKNKTSEGRCAWFGDVAACSRPRAAVRACATADVYVVDRVPASLEPARSAEESHAELARRRIATSASSPRRSACPCPIPCSTFGCCSVRGGRDRRVLCLLVLRRAAAAPRRVLEATPSRRRCVVSCCSVPRLRREATFVLIAPKPRLDDWSRRGRDAGRRVPLRRRVDRRIALWR